MKDTVEKLNQITENLNAFKMSAAKAEGVCNTIHKQLKDEFGVNTLEEAQELYNQMKADMDATEQRIKARVARLAAALEGSV